MRLPRLASLLAFRPPSREDTSNQRHSSLSIAPDHTSRPSPRSSNHISPTALLHAHTHIFPTSRIDPIIMADDKFYRLLGVSKVRLAFVSPGRQVVFPSPSLALSTELSLVSSTMLRMLPMTRLRRLTRRPYVPGLCFAPPPPPPHLPSTTTTPARLTFSGSFHLCSLAPFASPRPALVFCFSPLPSFHPRSGPTGSQAPPGP